MCRTWTMTSSTKVSFRALCCVCPDRWPSRSTRSPGARRRRGGRVDSTRTGRRAGWRSGSTWSTRPRSDRASVRSSSSVSGRWSPPRPVTSAHRRATASSRSSVSPNGSGRPCACRGADGRRRPRPPRGPAGSMTSGGERSPSKAAAPPGPTTNDQARTSRRRANRRETSRRRASRRDDQVSGRGERGPSRARRAPPRLSPGRCPLGRRRSG
jgi:hypothetical protein